MPRSNRIQQIYGYLVCLIAIITLLISAGRMIDAFFDLTRPQTAGIPTRYYGGPESSSYEAYRLNQLERYKNVKDSVGTIKVPSDSALRVQYDRERDDATALLHWESTKTIVTSALMIVLALILFVIHWRWLRGQSQSDPE